MEALSPRFQCASTESASGAIRLSEVEPFNLALIEAGQLGMSGLSLTRLILNRSPRTAVIALTDESEHEATYRGLERGCIGLHNETIELSDVVQTVERALKRYLPEAVA
jgi:DNA-binding NarL/FixJ family response regulator